MKLLTEFDLEKQYWRAVFIFSMLLFYCYSQAESSCLSVTYSPLRECGNSFRFTDNLISTHKDSINVRSG